jgi:aromatic ring hydroxylase
MRARLYDMAHEARHRELMSYVEDKTGERCNRAPKIAAHR